MGSFRGNYLEFFSISDSPQHNQTHVGFFTYENPLICAYEGLLKALNRPSYAHFKGYSIRGRSTISSSL